MTGFDERRISNGYVRFAFPSAVRGIPRSGGNRRAT
jgi:hypothetical protein